VDEAPSFHLYTRRSFSDYLWHWLEDAAREYGVVAAKPKESPCRRHLPAPSPETSGARHDPSGTRDDFIGVL
jgi:hypothetical protein